MNKSSTIDTSVTIIKPKSGWQFVDLKELKEYRDLFYFLAWREIKVLYAQTILGFSWAILHPFIRTKVLISGNLSNPFLRFTATGFIAALTHCSHSLKLITISKLVNRQPGTLNPFQP